MLKISECSENCNACCVFKISAHVENCNACSKLCWIFQDVLKTCWKFQDMLKTIICVESYVETACWKFQHVLKTVMHVESYVKISRCVENVYVRHVENHIENSVEVQKKHHHFTACVEIERQISFFSFGFAWVTEVRHRSFVTTIWNQVISLLSVKLSGTHLVSCTVMATWHRVLH